MWRVDWDVLAHTAHDLPYVVLMLVHRLRRWTSIKTLLVQRLVFAGL